MPRCNECANADKNGNCSLPIVINTFTDDYCSGFIKIIMTNKEAAERIKELLAYFYSLDADTDEKITIKALEKAVEVLETEEQNNADSN